MKALTRRAFLQSVGGSMAAATLAACTPNTEPDVPAATVPTTAAEPEVVEATAAPAPAAPVELSCWHIWSAGRIELMDDIFKRFNEQHPEIKATHEFVSGGSGALLQKIQTAVAGGTPPDVPMVRGFWVPEFAVHKTLLPLDDLVSTHGVDLDVFFPWVLPVSKWENKLYVLPCNADAGPLFFYNKSHYEEAGITAPPATWSGLVDTAQKLTRFEGDELSRIGLNWNLDFSTFFYMIYSKGAKAVSDDGRSYSVNGPEAVEALEYVVNNTKEIYGSTKAYLDFLDAQSELAITDSFQAQTSSQKFGGNWEVAVIELGDFEDLLYDVCPPPAPDGGQAKPVYYGGWNYGIASGVPHVEAAWELLHWLTIEPSAAGWFMIQQVRFPSLKAVVDDPAYTQYEQWEGVVKTAEIAVPVPTVPGLQEASGIINFALESAMAGDMSPQQALDDAQDQVQTLADTFFASLG